MAQEPKTTSDKEAAAAAAQRAEVQKAAEKAVDKGVAPAVSASEATNPKVVAPAGTVPSSMQAPGPSLPHPSSDKPTPLNDTPEMAEARARADAAVEAEDFGDSAPKNVGKPKGAPIQCIAKRKFFDERGALIRAGATYWYQRREGARFPIEVLEPVDKSLAVSLRKEAQEKSEEKARQQELRRKRREAFSRMALETE